MKAHEILMQLKAVSDFSDVQKNVDLMQKALAKLKLPDDFKKNFENIFSDLEKEAIKYQRFLDSGLKTKGDITGLEKSGERISNLFNRIHKEINKISDSEIDKIFKVDDDEVKKAQEKIKTIEKQIAEALNAGGKGNSIFSNLSKEIDNLRGLGSKSKFYEVFEKTLKSGNIEGASKALEDLKKNHKAFNDQAKNNDWNIYIGNLERGLNSLKQNTSIVKLTSDLKQAQQDFDGLRDIELEKNINSTREFGIAVGNASKEVYDLTLNKKNGAAASLKLSNTLDHFKEKAAYFFGLSNSIELFKRAVRDAYESVKELDKVMTETAVVTDFTIGDMWGQLPEYSKRASELGVSIKGAYESATLYYQQGLKTNEVIAASSETLKMARIAGMDYAEATNYMTAALRGFNMEINEQSAQRVNDVYSELAAITASDTEEISKAMTKTASIADSANMEFETTAAFLAQIIETTREAPETAGTALKTVIARFQELKKDPSEIGEVEGEIVDANKIEGALRTIDVALRDTNGQFRDLDDVFLEIASKWNTLDLNTQRYIATMAAGSRQQSRFIAMMSDYDRTMELVNAANNSAGASQEQFEKTLESLESKVARLNNAWTNFTMGIANNTLIKVGVDAIYGLIEAVNKMTDILPGGTSGIAKLAVSLASLKTGGKIFDNLFKNFKEQDKDKAPFERIAGATSKSLDDLKKTLTVKSEELKEVFSRDYWLLSPKDAQNFKNQLDFLDSLKGDSGDELQNSLNTEKYTEQLGLLDNQLKLVTDSKLDYNKIQKIGLTNEQTAVLLSRKSVQAKVNDILATKFETEAAREEALAETLEQAAKERGIVIRAKDAIAKARDTLATKLLTEAEYEAAVAAGTLNVALLKLLAPMAAMVGLFIYAYKNSPEAVFEKASQATKKATEAANEAKSAYDNLLSGQEKYNELQNKLEGLTKGTKEWEQALFEANQQVLELLQNYEGLKVTTGENGKLEITNLDEIIEHQKELANTAQMAVAAATIREKELRSTLSAPISDRAPLDPTVRNTVLKNYKEADKNFLDDWYYSGKLTEVKHAYENLEDGKRTSEDLKLVAEFEDTFTRGKNSIDEFIDKTEEYAAAQRELTNATQTVSASLITTLSPQEREAESSSIVSDAVARFGVDNNQQLWAEARNEYAWNLEPALRKAYKDVYGNDADEDMSADELRDALAEAGVGKKLEETTKNLIKLVEDPSSDSEAILGYLSGGGTLKRGEAEGFSLSDATIKDLATELGIEESVIEDEVDRIQEDTDKRFGDVLTNAIKLLGGEGSQGEIIANKANDILANANLSQYEGYMKNLTTLMGRAAAEGGEKAGIAAGNFFNDKLNSLLELVEDDESKQKILDIFASADFTTEQGIKEFGEDLEEVDDKLKNVDMNQLINELIDLADAAKNVDLSNLLGQVKSLRDLADSIRDRKREEGVSQEEFDAIIKDGVAEIGDFVFTGQEYIYKGTMEELANAINNSSNKLLDGVIPTIEESINRGDKVAEILDSGKYAENQERIISGELDVTKDEDRIIARDFLKNLGTDEEVVNSLNDAALSSAITSALEDYNNRFTNKEQLKDRETHAIQAELYGMSAAEMEASGYDADIIKEVQQLKIENEGLEATLSQLRKGFKITNGEADKYEGLLIDLASSTKKAKESQAQLAKIVGDNNEALKSSDPVEYTTALQEIHEQAEKTFGMDLSESFVESNIKKFIDLAKGGKIGQEAFYELGKLAGEEYLKGLDTFKGDAEALIVEVLSLIPEDVKMGITAEMDATALWNTIKDAGIGLTELKNLINSLGFSMEIETEKLWVDSQGNIIGNTAQAIEKFGGTAALSTLHQKEIPKSAVIVGNDTGNNSYKGPKSSSSKWENPYDKQYNTLEKINEAIRQRELLEKKLQLLQAQGLASEKDYLDTYKQIESNLKYQLKLQEELRAGRKGELNDLLAANAQFSKYAKYNESSGTLSIDYAAINSIKKTDTKTGEALEKFVSELERIVGALEDIEAEIIEIEQNQAELQQEYTDAYLSLEDRTVAALEKIRQDEIDTLQEGFDALTEAEEELADAISKSIDEMRQARENEKTEEDIAEKERRLAYLRQDTTGSNALEIKRLEEEIAEQRESYQDSLIDQSLENLQEQNEAAAEQREKQIELMESQLEHDLETGALVEEATDLINRAMQDGMMTHDDKLWDVLSAGEGWPSKSKVALDEILKELREQFGKASMMGSNGGVSSEVDLNRDYMNEMITKYHQAGDVITPGILELNRLRNEKINSPNYKGSQKPIDEKDLEAELNKIDQAYDYSSDMIDLYKASGGRITDEIRTLNWRRNEKIDANAYGGSQSQLETEEDLIAWLEKHTGIKHKFKTGGLADFTGPAWLDGSKSKPELVLNAQDTQNFIMLKDILSGVLSGAPASKASGGDNYFDIDIQVEEISNDYDVDQMAERIKQNIYEDSMYRNVNAVNFLR